jgi:hypothetical protein
MVEAAYAKRLGGGMQNQKQRQGLGIARKRVRLTPRMSAGHLKCPWRSPNGSSEGRPNNIV